MSEAIAVPAEGVAERAPSAVVAARALSRQYGAGDTAVQALRGVEEKVDANTGQPPAALAARGRVLVGCKHSDRPFFRHHCACDYPICVNFPSTATNGARAGR